MSEDKKYISELNNYVEDYLDYYCGLSTSPGFAVLLKGEWGCGKTWFIKEYCKKLEENKSEEIYNNKPRYQKLLSKPKFEKKSKLNDSDEATHKAHLYVSLYGLTSLNDIEAEFLHQSFPGFLSSKGMEILKKTGIEIIKSQLRFDSNSLIKDVTGLFNKNNQDILIFDDLERCKIDIIDILGYINNCVEHQERKVIILANEGKLLETDIYRSIREKVIGRNFKIDFDFYSALKSFIKDVHSPDIKEFLSNNAQLIEEIYQTADYRNLRSLKNIILDFERIFQELPDKAKVKPELLQEILQVLTAFSIEIKRGNILPKEICQLQEAEKYKTKQLRQSVINQQEGKEEIKFSYQQIHKFTSLQEITNKFTCIKNLVYDLYNPILNLSWWQNFFEKGIVQDKFQDYILNSRYFIDKKTTPNWMKLYDFRRNILSDEEFENLLEKVEEEFANRNFTDIGEIKHVTGLLLYFSHLEIYSKIKEKPLKNSKGYVDDLIADNRLDLNPGSDDNDLIEFIFPYQERRFQGQEIEEFQEFCVYFQTARQSALDRNLPSMSSELLHIMEDNPQQFKRIICPNKLSHEANALDQKYIRVPIMKYINPNDFISKILSMSFEHKAYCLSGLQERYIFEYIGKNLVEELDWLKSFQNLLIQEVDRKQGKLSGLYLKELNEYYLNDAIANLEKYK